MAALKKFERKSKTLKTTMMDVPLSLNHFLERAGKIFSTIQIVSRRPDKAYSSITYGEFYERSRLLAQALLDLGLEKGEAVATLCWNHNVHLECYFGIPACGGVVHTLNLRLSPEEIGWIAADANDRFLIVDDILLPLYEKIKQFYNFEKVIVYSFSGTKTAPEFIDYEELLKATDSSQFNYVAHNENDPVSMCYTSGTTGRPKGVVYSHRSTVLHALVGASVDALGMKSNDIVLPVTPMFHVNCWGVPHLAVMTGSKMLFPGPHLHPDDLLDLMLVQRPTLALGVPSIWLGLIQTFKAAEAKDSGRWKMPAGMRCLIGGSAVPEFLIRQFHDYGIEVQQAWGMTETSPLGTVSYKRAEFQNSGEDEQFRRAALTGTPAPLVSLRIRNEDGEDAEWDGKEIGEVQLQGPFVTGSYFEHPVSEENFTGDGWLRTGDVGKMDQYGYLQITDRTKDLIKSGGEWISSVDLENALMAHPDIMEAAVIAVPDPKWAERPLACLVVRPDQNPSQTALNAFLLSRGFAKWQLPDRYELLKEIPKTSTGKFSKLKLRQMFPK